MLGFVILFFIVIVLAAIFMLFSMGSGITEKYKRRGIWLAAIKQAHQMDEIVSDDQNALGIDPKERRFAVVQRSGDGYVFTYDHVASVELTPIYVTEIDSTSETRTTRGSQLIGAGIGVAVAGPAGLVVGGLSGKSTTHTSGTSSENLSKLELAVRLYSDELPRVKIKADTRFEEVEAFAARLANIIDQRKEQPRNLPPPVAITTEVDARLSSPRPNWAERTFGN